MRMKNSQKGCMGQFAPLDVGFTKTIGPAVEVAEFMTLLAIHSF